MGSIFCNGVAQKAVQDLGNLTGICLDLDRLADNLDWLAANARKTVAGTPNVQRRKRDAEHKEQAADHAEQENILRSLGGAVILNWVLQPNHSSECEDGNALPPFLPFALQSGPSIGCQFRPGQAPVRL